MNGTLPFTEQYRVAVNPLDPEDMNIAVEDAGFFKKRSGVGNTNWDEFSNGCDGTNVIHGSAGSDVFLGSKAVNLFSTCGFNIYYSSNGGNSWPYTPTMNWSYWGGLDDWIAPMALYPDLNTPNVFYCPRRNGASQFNHRYIDINVGTYSTNNGFSWSQNPGNITQINTGDEYGSPQGITFCESNKNIIYVLVTNTDYYHHGDIASRLWKTTDGGINWNEKLIHNHGVPNRVITSVVTDPQPGYENVVYLTLSGYSDLAPNYDQGHVFKSIDGGNNWTYIDEIPLDQGSGLPNLPVNFMILRKLTPCRNQLIISNDAGVYQATDVNCPGIQSIDSWTPVAAHLPVGVNMGLDFNEASGKLRTAFFGRGIWEVPVSNSWNITYEQPLIAGSNGLDVNQDVVVTDIGSLVIPSGCTIKMGEAKRIIVQDGGSIDCSSGNAVTFTSQSGSWGGIEFQGSASGTLQNCTFSNTDTPISIDGTGGTYGPTGPPAIIIKGCTFNSGSVSVVSRDNVSIQNCVTNSPSAITNTAYSIVYGSNIVLDKNTIHDAPIGISVSNSSPAILSNIIDLTNPGNGQNAIAGISLDNSYSSTVNYNSITGYINGIYMFYSSPTVLNNVVTDDYTYSGDSLVPAALTAKYLSSPRLAPSGSGDRTVWDAGINSLRSNGIGDGTYIENMSIPNVDYGNNTIYGQAYNFDGWTGYSGGLGNYIYNARSNCWVNPFVENVSDADFVIDPQMSCGMHKGGGGSNNSESVPVGLNPKSGEVQSEIENLNSQISSPFDPLQPIIINYGNGVYDTIQVTSQVLNLSANYLLYSQAVGSEMSGQYQQAINTYKQLIQSYADSSSSVSALKKILHCYDKLNSTSQQYGDLRTYYQGVAQNNHNDTALVKTANELATKCLVRTGAFPTAITEYESVLNSSHDSLQVLCSQLNIIETYMIMQQTGGTGKTSGFTGQHAELKPVAKKDGIKMINQLLHHLNIKSKTAQIPTKFSLSQNYPNPFNPTTKINYALPNASKVSIKIYDILGRVVKQLVNEFKDAGYYSEIFDGTNLASGVYFYRIEAGKFVESKKMVIVK